MLSTGIAMGISLATLPTAALLAQSPEGSASADGFIVRNGQIYQLRNGQATPLGSDAVMRITPAGEITGFDGQRRRLNENTVLTLDGRVLPAPPGVIFSTPQPAAGTESQVEDRFSQSRQQQRAVSGENLSGLATGVPGKQAAGAQEQTASPANGSVPSTGETVRGDGNRENMNSNTSGVVDPVTGLPFASSTVPAVSGNQQTPSTTNSANAGNSDAANTNGVQSGTQAQTGAANTNGFQATQPNSANGNTNAATSTQQAQPQGSQGQSTQTQQSQGFSRQGVGSNSGTGINSGTGPQSRPNSTNATQGGNGPNHRVNSSNASGGSTGGSSGGGAGSGSGGAGGAGGATR